MTKNQKNTFSLKWLWDDGEATLSLLALFSFLICKMRGLDIMTSKFPSNSEENRIIGSASQAIAFILGADTKRWLLA